MAGMDFLRLLLLFGLLMYGVAATEHARSVIKENRKGADQVSTRWGEAYTRHVAGCEVVLPVSLVVQDGMLPDTQPAHVTEPDPAMYSRTEAIQDVSRGVKTSAMKKGILYTSNACTLPNFNAFP